MISFAIYILACYIFQPDPNGAFWIFLVVALALACIEIIMVVLSIIYRHNINSNTPTLKLRQFLLLYRVDPSKWDLEYSGVSYRGNDGHYTYAKFASYFDYHMYRYLCWRRKINEDKVTALKTQADFVKQLQSDLTSTREEIDDLIKKELKKCVNEETD